MSHDDDDSISAGAVYGILAVIAAIVLLVVFLMGHTTIDTGHVGIVTQNGAATGDVLQPGFNWLLPPGIRGSVDMNTQVQKSSVTTNARTRDSQIIQTLTVVVNYQLDATTPTATITNTHPLNNAVDLFKRVGTNYEQVVIDNAVLDSIKAAMGQYTAQNLAVDYTIAQSLIKSKLQDRLHQYHILIPDVSITDFHFSDAYNAAIERNQVAGRDVQTAQQALAQARVDAQQRVAQADADAQAQVVRAQAQATAQTLQQKSLSPAYLQWSALQRWNGVLPSVNSGGNIPFLMTIPQITPTPAP